MPFVDINSITPKVKPVSTNPVTASDDTTSEVKVMPGPKFNAEPAMTLPDLGSPVSAGNLPTSFVDAQQTPQQVIETPIAPVEVMPTTAEPMPQVDFSAPIVEPVVLPTPVVEELVQPVVEVAPTTPVAPSITEVEIERKPDIPTYTITPNVEVAAEPVAPAVVQPVAEITPVVPQVVEPTLPVVPETQTVVEPAVSTEVSLPQVTEPDSSKLTQVVVPTSDQIEVAAADMSLDEYLQMAVALGASDIHFTVGYRVVVRVNGKFQNLTSPVISPEQTAEYAKLMFEYKGLKNYARIKDYDMAYQLNGGRFRLNIYKQQNVYGLVFRLIPTEIRSIEQLALPTTLLDFAKLAYGLVLVTGPTGSGKSTTLAAIINYINQTQAKHIITIEDPVEYIYPKGLSIIDQREILQDTDSWDNALKSVLRQDPDVVLVGEMRDYETIANAIRIAETGHLVFGTLHTNSAAQTIDRIIDVFPEHQQSQIRVQLANSLQGVISQRLIPLSNGSSRHPAIEILVANDAVRSSIRDNKTHQIDNIIQTGAEFGMMTLEKSLVNLVRGGLISTERAQEFTNKPDEIVALLRKA